MGVSILASWRHPHVVVMAPALTEAGQSRNYKSSPSTSLKNLIDSCLYSPLLSASSEVHVDCKLKGKEFVNGFGKDLKISPVDRQKANGILKAHASQLPLRSANINGKLESPKPEEIVVENLSMNNSAPMGDQSDNMGLLKSSTQSNLLDDQAENMGFLKTINQHVEMSGFMKEKTLTNDMDQLFKNLSAAITCTDLSPGDFPPPNVEELLQVIKSMENTCEPSDAALDAPTDRVEPEEMFPLSGTDLASFERELLDDMMTNFDEHLPDSGLDMKESLTKEKLEDVNKRQFEIERKCERLQRRLKKLQARCVGKHAGEELTGLFEHAHRLTRQGLSGSLSTKSEDQVGKDKKIKGVSELALSTLVNRLTISSINQASGLVRYRPAVKYFGSGSTDIPPQSETLPGSILPKLSDEEREEVKAVAQQLHTQVHLLQNHLDSDVTASSSGGESCDEMQAYNNPHQSHQSIGNRALWRWSQDRAGVASRWTWLQAQISDLEYKIRQHTEYHRQIRAGKGPVMLGEEGARRPQQRTTPPVSVNGYHGSLPGGVSINLKPNEEILNGTIPFQTNNCDPTMTASRTRPFVKSAYRKRKLLRTNGLHLVSKKAARPVTVRCGCRPPLSSCALCTGRSDPTRPNRFEPSTVPERIAMVDFSFHPVLSFPSDTSLTVHLDAMMRLHEWQAKANRCNVKLKFNKCSTGKDKSSSLDRRQRLKKKLKLSEHKNLRKIRKHTAAVLSAKLKKKLSANQKKRRDLTNSEHLPLSLLKMKKSRKHSLRSNLDGDSEEDGEMSVKTVPVDRDGRSSRRTSPESSPGPFISSKDRSEKRERDRSEDGRRRREDDSYDIDNIVIPYSMAAVKRVEKLQYKEILTPKWRIVEDYEFLSRDLNDSTKEAGVESETEDMTDEAFLERHSRCEESEKKKFMSYIKLPFAVRSRANRRTDSRAESSGANTPDPMSPINPDHPESGGTVSPLTTPPSTPLSVLDEQYQPINARKRTTSSSRMHLREKLERASSDKDKEERCSTPDIEDEVLPYEPRVYPLSDEVYEEMMKGMPEDHAPYMSFKHLPGKNYSIDHRMPESPSTSSTISAVEEDPNDPEWTVVNALCRCLVGGHPQQPGELALLATEKYNVPQSHSARALPSRSACLGKQQQRLQCDCRGEPSLSKKSGSNAFCISHPLSPSLDCTTRCLARSPRSSDVPDSVLSAHTPSQRTPNRTPRHPPKPPDRRPPHVLPCCCSHL